MRVGKISRKVFCIFKVKHFRTVFPPYFDFNEQSVKTVFLLLAVLVLPFYSILDLFMQLMLAHVLISNCP